MSFLFSKIKNQQSSKLPFVCYCKPNSDKIIALFQKNDDLISLDDADVGFAFVSFDNEKRYLIPEHLSDIYFETVSTSNYIFPKTLISEIDLDAKVAFESLVENGVEAIHQGVFEKVVLSRKESIELGLRQAQSDKELSFDIELVFNKLILNYPTAFKYCFYHPKVGFWIGATPEQFLKVDENVVKTVSLAGTQLFDEKEAAIWHNKEIEEQQIVTDYIVNNLKLYADDVTFSKPYTHQAGSLVHIKSDIQAMVNDENSISKIINVLHPTPAVCGFPKEKAKQFILENEGYPREFYAGFLGEWNKDFITFKQKQSDLFVNLRCMKIEDSVANLYIGCGITKESNPEKEFIETVNKSQTMKKVL